jgi:hypothetical protein
MAFKLKLLVYYLACDRSAHSVRPVLRVYKSESHAEEVTIAASI